MLPSTRVFPSKYLRFSYILIFIALQTIYLILIQKFLPRYKFTEFPLCFHLYYSLKLILYFIKTVAIYSLFLRLFYKSNYCTVPVHFSPVILHYNHELPSTNTTYSIKHTRYSHFKNRNKFRYINNSSLNVTRL
jgi:hypothetical protein